MRLLRSIAPLADLPLPVHLALGFFDGMHLGHQRVVASADTPGALRGVLTFAEHPLALLAPERQPNLICPSARPSLLPGQGVDVLLRLPFTRKLAATTAEDFLNQLAATGRVCGLSVGRNWRFGRGGAGDTDLLQAWGAAHGIRVVLNELAELGGEVVCSSRIRELLAAGRLDRAAAMLGRPFSIVGCVEHGQHLARTLGFPTANIALPPHSALPPFGVYAVHGLIGGRIRRGIANLGLRPTIDEAHKIVRLETHFTDFSGDLYGQELDIALDRFIRPEQRFPSIEALRAAIAADIEKVSQASLSGKAR